VDLCWGLTRYSVRRDLRIRGGRGRDRLALEKAEGLLLLAWRAREGPLCNGSKDAKLCRLVCSMCAADSRSMLEAYAHCKGGTTACKTVAMQSHKRPSCGRSCMRALQFLGPHGERQSME
jgi:hypothetical protein